MKLLFSTKFGPVWANAAGSAKTKANPANDCLILIFNNKKAINAMASRMRRVNMLFFS